VFAINGVGNNDMSCLFAINGVGKNDMSGDNSDADGDFGSGDSTLIGENIWVPKLRL